MFNPRQIIDALAWKLGVDPRDSRQMAMLGVFTNRPCDPEKVRLTIEAAVSSDAENRRYVAEFTTEPRYAWHMSLTAYVAMRRVDDGLDELEPATVVRDRIRRR